MQTVSDLGSYTLPALLRNSAAKFADCNALSFVTGKPITYAQLAAQADVFSHQLMRYGLKKGDFVAIFSTSMPNWGAAYFGIVNRGLVAVPLLPDFTATEVETILEHADVKGIFVSKKLYAKIQHIDARILPFIVQLDDGELLRGSYVQEDSAVLEDASVQEEDLASVIYTSGTTGRSKGVMLTHKNLVFTAIQCQTIQRVNKRDKCLSFLPLSHVYEFTIGFLMQILCGACIYYLGRPPAVSTLLPAMTTIRPTIMLSVPIIMEKIYKNKIVPLFTKNAFLKKIYAIRFFQRILHRIAGKSLYKTFGGKLKFFGIGGAKVDPVVEQFMKDAHFPYAIGYGLTETSPLLAGSNPKKTRPGTIGPMMEGIDVRILNPDPQTGIGEVIAKGENVMRGYYKEPELTAEVFTTETDSCGAGWFKTGDLGVFEKKNYLALKGRLKNMILGSSGENIYPEDIEFVLNQHPMVQESLVVEDEEGLVALVQLDEDKIKAAVKNGNAAEVLSAVSEVINDKMQELREDFLYKQEELLTEIKFFVNNKVNRFSKVGRVQVIEKFEKTASQKIKRYLYNLKKATGNTEPDSTSNAHTEEDKK